MDNDLEVRTEVGHRAVAIVLVCGFVSLVSLVGLVIWMML